MHPQMGMCFKSNISTHDNCQLENKSKKGPFTAITWMEMVLFEVKCFDLIIVCLRIKGYLAGLMEIGDVRNPDYLPSTGDI